MRRGQVVGVPDDQQYDALASVYDFLVPESLLDPGGSFAGFRELVEDLPRGAAVLDRAWAGISGSRPGAGWIRRTASGASAAMTARAIALAESYSVALTVIG